MLRLLAFLFFSSRRRHTRLQGDWSSDVCSSDLPRGSAAEPGRLEADLHAQLHTARAAGSGDVTVVGVRDVGGRVAELCRIGDAERLTADLFHLLREAEDLEDGKVGVEE